MKLLGSSQGKPGGFNLSRVRYKILAIAFATLLAVGSIGVIFLQQRTDLDALTRAESIAAAQSRGLADAKILAASVRSKVFELTLVPSQAADDTAKQAQQLVLDRLEDTAFVPEVQEQLKGLAGQVQTVTDAVENLGLTEDQGLTGKLRQSAEAIDQAINQQIAKGVNAWDSLAHALMLKERERDFVAHRDAAHVDGFNTEVEAFGKQIMESWLADDVKTALSGLLDAYSLAFSQFASGVAAVRDGMTGFDVAETAVQASLTQMDQDYAVRAAASKKALDAKWDEFSLSILLVIGIAAIVSLGLALMIGASIEMPLSRLNRTMRQLADGHLETEIAGLKRRDEIGEMAQTVEVFRDNGVRVRQMTDESEAASQRRREERAVMMQELQRAFGKVVDAAIAGDFSQRVTSEFPDAELNALARSVNDLVETVDRGLGETGKVLAALAHTDLTHRVTGAYQGSFARLKDDTNAVSEKLTEIVGQLRQTSRGLKTATGEILSGANDLSERTTKQAATIEETSAAMEQLAQTVMENAKRAGGASDQANKASHIAEAGGKVMAEANQAMERISASSSKISNIIGMIDDIAFQTNLLALNASVEAARAGEAGKGFAVVAVEVRRLAQSAAQASSEVKVLIEQSGVEVAGGSKLVANAAEKLAAILEAVKTNAGQMEEIAKDSRAQASAIDEVNVAVRQMDEMTQHNAALVEQTNAAIEQTEAQASELDRVVDVFTLAETVTHGARPAPQARPLAKPAFRSAPEPRSGIKGLQDRVRRAVKGPLSQQSTAADSGKDWSEF